MNKIQSIILTILVVAVSFFAVDSFAGYVEERVGKYLEIMK